MTTPAAIRGSYAHFQLVPTRKVVKIVIEAPIEQAQDVINALGFPGANEETWLAVARLASHDSPEMTSNESCVSSDDDKPEPDKPKSSNRIAAIMLCKDPMFWKFLTATDWVTGTEETAAKYVRAKCGVDSRTDLDGNQEAATIFHRIRGQFEAWRSGEAV